jgi:hypothetical protein
MRAECTSAALPPHNERRRRPAAGKRKSQDGMRRAGPADSRDRAGDDDFADSSQANGIGTHPARLGSGIENTIAELERALAGRTSCHELGAGRRIAQGLHLFGSPGKETAPPRNRRVNRRFAAPGPSGPDCGIASSSARAPWQSSDAPDARRSGSYETCARPRNQRDPDGALGPEPAKVKPRL